MRDRSVLSTGAQLCIIVIYGFSLGRVCHCHACKSSPNRGGLIRDWRFPGDFFFMLKCHYNTIDWKNKEERKLEPCYFIHWRKERWILKMLYNNLVFSSWILLKLNVPCTFPHSQNTWHQVLLHSVDDNFGKHRTINRPHLIVFTHGISLTRLILLFCWKRTSARFTHNHFIFKNIIWPDAVMQSNVLLKN